MGRRPAIKGARLTPSDLATLIPRVVLACNVPGPDGTKSYDHAEKQSESREHAALRRAAVRRADILGLRVYIGGVGVRGVAGFVDVVVELGGAVAFIECLSIHGIEQDTLERKRNIAQAAGVPLIFVVSMTGYARDFRPDDSVVVLVKGKRELITADECDRGPCSNCQRRLIGVNTGQWVGGALACDDCQDIVRREREAARKEAREARIAHTRGLLEAERKRRAERAAATRRRNAPLRVPCARCGKPHLPGRVYVPPQVGRFGAGVCRRCLGYMCLLSHSTVVE
jgi:hypothetical protein